MLHNILLIINCYTPNLININQEYSDKYVYYDYGLYDEALYIRDNDRYSAYNWRNMKSYSYGYNSIYSLMGDYMRIIGTLPLCMRRI